MTTLIAPKPQHSTQVLVYKTDISTLKKVKDLKRFLNTYSGILDWSVDLEDIDNVLWIKASKYFNADFLVWRLQMQGYSCEPLPD